MLDPSELPKDALSLVRIHADVYIFDEVKTGKNLFDMVNFVQHGYKVVFTYYTSATEPADVIESLKLDLATYSLSEYPGMSVESAQRSLDSLLELLEQVTSNKKQCFLFHTKSISAT